MKDSALYRGDLVDVRSPSGEFSRRLTNSAHSPVFRSCPRWLSIAAGISRWTAGRTRICDTVNYTGSRRIPNTVLLENLRCDGSGHDGCQAECRIFWKEAWLRKVAPGAPPAAPFPASDARALFERTLRGHPYEHGEGR